MQRLTTFKWYHLIFGLLYFTWSQVAIMAVSLIPQMNNSSGVITGVVVSLCNIGIIYKGFKTIKRSQDIDEDIAPRLKPAMVATIFIIMMCMIVATAIVNLLINKGSSANQNVLEELFQATPLLSAIHIIAIAPLCEEMFFRYYFVKPGRFLILRFIISWMIFIAIHITSKDPFTVVIAYAVPATFIHGTRYIFGSVRYSLLLHAMYNSVVVYTMLAI